MNTPASAAVLELSEPVTGVHGYQARDRNAPRFPRQRDSQTLKIIVVGTPKTGNTWLKHLLAVYDLPIIALGLCFSPEEATAAGTRWIAHQHFLPTQDLVTWGLENQVVFITAIRHPGDVLVSLWHHVREQKAPASTPNASYAAVMRLDDHEGIGTHTLRFVEEGFHLHLNMSVAWMRSRLTLVARYEELWDRPLETLRDVTAQISPVAEERLGLAISSCELTMMQSLLDPRKKFFRRGGRGAWLELPKAIKASLQTLEPYPQQFLALGYTMDEEDPANWPSQNLATHSSLFGENKSFQNGVAITPVLMKLYFELPRSLRLRWPNPRATGAGSFFAWLNQPAEGDSHRAHATPVITELAAYLYTTRPDLCHAFPDLFGADRWRFHEWFLFTARKEYALAPSFLQANPFPENDRFDDGTPTCYLFVRLWTLLPAATRARWPDPASTKPSDSFLNWLSSPAHADPDAERVPVITELGAFLHSIRPDVARAMPDLYGRHRVDFSNWFISSAREEYSLGRRFTLPVIRSWAEIGGSRVPANAWNETHSA